MLPSMPILFARESQEAFGNKILPSTSFFSQNTVPKFVINPEVPVFVPEATQEAPKQEEIKTKKDPEKKKKSDPPCADDNALEYAFIRSYYQRVQSRFSSNSVPTNKFVKFQNILRNFNPNIETPVDLYKKVEELFGEEHKDIVEDFLLFLKPGQAAEVGRFMDRLMLGQMTGFINCLHSTFARKPTVLRKVLRALTNGTNSGNSEEMKSRLMPHFRSHPRLMQMFKSLFPDERPSDSLYETGVDMINESFLSQDKEYEVWEFEEEINNKQKPKAKDGLDTMYLNGRVFLQHGRLLRSARVTYPYSKEPYRVHSRRLAPAHCHLTPPDSDEEPEKTNKNKVPPKKPRKQARSPTKKDVNDNTKKDCQILSPKPKRSQCKSKNGKKELECKIEQKKERKDSKIAVLKKYIDAPKAKQAKFDPIIIQIKTENSETAEAKVETESVEENMVDASSNDSKSNWTRSEDKTMLEVLKGEAGSEKVFAKIRELLPHRSASEIKERFCHVMTLLQQMSVGEVT